MDEALASYSPWEHLIRVDHTLRQEPLSVISAVLAHEVVHAARISPDAIMFQDRRAAAAACYSEELLARAWETDTWARIRLGTETTRASAWLDHLVQLQRNGRLDETVLLSDGYQEACLGQTLPEY